MNIFMMILVFILMAGYFLMDAPNQNVNDNRIESAMQTNNTKSILSCMARAHAAATAQDTKNPAKAKEVLNSKPEKCTQKYNVQSIKLCANENREINTCTTDRIGRVVGNFIVTTANKPDEKDTNLLLEILSKDYNTTPNFGMIISAEDGGLSILSGNGHRRAIPNSIIKSAKLADGQLVYITQYSVSADVNLGSPEMSAAEDIFCMTGQQKVFRFGKWECLTPNTPVLCTGDTIWNSATETCEIDPSRRPLCATGQTAVEIDGIWNCIDPFDVIECPTGQIPKFDYVNVEWYCAEEIKNTETKCNDVLVDKGNLLGGTLLKPTSPCGDCEKMVLNEETCRVACIPDKTKISIPACYPDYRECSGTDRAFYFGFPWDSAYTENIVPNLPELAGVEIPLDDDHSINRKFNCMDCSAKCGINTELSLPPYVVVCNGCD